jgi:tetratricopeptide (TPR) repeat protein
VYRNFRYWGFLSYSHDDRRAAERLHRALEAYRIPARLVGLDGPFGPVPTRLLPIFRDRDELNAGGRLGPQVEQALSVSRSLIVLCSPAAASSPWVDAEVDAFIRLQPEAPLFCVILAGEPGLQSQASDLAAECLSPAARVRFGSGLDGNTPIAVDLRAHGDGWRLAVHKIVAGLTGLPLDQLVQRDAQRRHRRMAWLSTMLVAVALALGLFAALAYRARDEARQQRAQAEGLIEFMLVDLRKRLEPVGRLDALEAVGTRALAYYDSQSLKSLDPDSLGRRARALHLIGEIDDRRGDDRGARSAFARASASTGELLLREPDHPQRLYDHAQSVFWNGYIDWQYGETADAERAFKEYARLSQALSAKDPANPDWLAEVASAHSNLASLLLEQGRAGEAIPEFMESLRVDQRRATLSDGGDAAQLDIAQDHSWLSSAYYANRKLGQAIAERNAEMAIYERLAGAAPDNAVVRERQVIGHRFLGELQLSAGARERARAELERALALAAAQARLDPDNVNWQVPAAQAHVVAARLERLSGDTGRAQRHLDAAASLLAAQLRRDPEQWTWRIDIQESVAGEQAALLLHEGRLVEAGTMLMASQQRLRDVGLQPSSAARILRYRIANASMQAELARLRGDPDSERAHWQDVAALADGRGDSLDGESAQLLARAWKSIRKGTEARQLESRLLAAGYRLGAAGFDDGADLAPR